MKTLIVITGPTGSGKTGLAVELALRLGCEVVSADSRQIYRGMPIGTAAPTTEEMKGVSHHFVEMLDPGEYYSAALYEEQALKVLDELWQKGDYAVMCGGSMMYVDAVVNGIDELPTISPEIREQVKELHEREGLEGITRRLRQLDPVYLEGADLKNHMRMVHALEICLESGMPYSAMRTGCRKQRPFRVVKFAIHREREEMFDRINRRVEQMVEHGLVDEVRRLLPLRGENALNTVGYKEMFRMLDGEWDMATAVARMQKNTRVYAKKQLTWLKRGDNDVIWLDPKGDMIAEIMQRVSTFTE